MQQVKAVTFYIVLCNVFILINTFIHYKMYNSSSKIATEYTADYDYSYKMYNNNKPQQIQCNHCNYSL